jgi:hypothetical protein
LLVEAVAAYRATLEVRTREQLPQDYYHQIVSNSLVIARAELNKREHGSAA